MTENHKGSSYNIGRMIAPKISSEDDTKCLFYEEKNRIMTEVESADVLIFTTLTYCMRAFASMKSFIDLTSTYWMSHRPKKCMFDKKAIVVLSK